MLHNWKYVTSDNVSMSVGHLDHVLIVYSSMEHVCLARTAPAHTLKRQAGSSVWGSRNTRKKWTLSLLQGKSLRRARESSVTHKSAITNHAVEENHVIDWDKAKVVDRQAQRQTRWITEALWIRKTPMCMNRDAGPTQPHMGPSSCKQSRRDQDVRRTSKRCH